MMKTLILIRADKNILEYHKFNYPDDVIPLKEYYKLIGCKYIEVVNCKQLRLIVNSNTHKCNPILAVDEAGLYEENPKVNKLASYLAGQPLVGNVIITNQILNKNGEIDIDGFSEEALELLSILTQAEIIVHENQE